MYRDHYGLVRLPFEMTPDPAFLYLGECHREGLATLVYGVRSGKGFVMLTGEVGTGKTTLLHALLGQLDADTASAYIFNPRLDAMDFFRVLFDEYGIEHECRTKAEYLLRLNHFLIDRLGKNQKTLLIIDEAQQLSPTMLEEVRLLSNLETPTSKLLQIMLVGQPELNEMLAQPELRQLRQRIVLRHHLRPFDERELDAYVDPILAQLKVETQDQQAPLLMARKAREITYIESVSAAVAMLKLDPRSFELSIRVVTPLEE